MHLNRSGDNLVKGEAGIKSCERKVVEENGVIYTVDALGNRVGCGADDKNGLWVIINLLHSEPAMKAALFVQQECAVFHSLMM